MGVNWLLFRGSLDGCEEGFCHEDKKRSDTQRKKRQPQIGYVEGLWEIFQQVARLFLCLLPKLTFKKPMVISVHSSHTLNCVVSGFALSRPSQSVCHTLFSFLPTVNVPTSAPVSHTPQHTHLHQPAQHGHEIHLLWPEVIYTTVHTHTAAHDTHYTVHLANRLVKRCLNLI